MAQSLDIKYHDDVNDHHYRQLRIKYNDSIVLHFYVNNFIIAEDLINSLENIINNVNPYLHIFNPLVGDSLGIDYFVDHISFGLYKGDNSLEFNIDVTCDTSRSIVLEKLTTIVQKIKTNYNIN